MKQVQQLEMLTDWLEQAQQLESLTDLLGGVVNSRMIGVWFKLLYWKRIRNVWK